MRALRELFAEGYRINWTASCVMVITFAVTFLVFPFQVAHQGLTYFDIAYWALCWFFGSLSVTLYYHRVLTHQAARLHPAMEFVFLTGACLMLQNHAQGWCAKHLVHHRETDQPADPYGRQRGFWFAHMGWIFLYPPRLAVEVPRRIHENRLIQWQRHYYIPIFLTLQGVLPVMIGVAFFDQSWWEPLVVSCARMTVINQAAFCANSVCHSIGSQQFHTSDSSRNVWWLFTLLGEQFHNTHHALPSDYRAGLRWYHFDAIKWTLFLLSCVGLASNLRRTPRWIIERALSRTALAKLQKRFPRRAESTLRVLERRRLRYIQVLKVWEQSGCCKMQRARVTRARRLWRQSLRRIPDGELAPNAVSAAIATP